MPDVIRIKPKTYRELKKIGQFGETPDDVIMRLIKERKPSKFVRIEPALNRSEPH